MKLHCDFCNYIDIKQKVCYNSHRNITKKVNYWGLEKKRPPSVYPLMDTAEGLNIYIAEGLNIYIKED